ncbi:MAG TPA: inorganic phosphate transporter [Chitinophagaceae bacterium]|nr:inorganic phosphate transporter [Chitinophagaceae bacterium]HNU16100.1 inorganic phosphate transporter [Chitinophagaceae bacterium]
MTFLIFLVVVLFILAITDLVVGVSNDAVNFLNSAIGSRVARYNTIIIVAAAGIIIGSVFSSGIMEIARKGVFHPEFFTLSDLMWVFLAVMITDIVLLDVFNTLGLPTSTTVSIIFELLGASLITGILISVEKDEPVSTMMKYINAESVTTIISGIFLSIIIAFTAGILIQYLSRLVFTFNYEDNLKKYGALFAGIGITSIIYFLLIKGLKGTTLLSPGITSWAMNNTILILSVLFAACFIISFLLQRFASINPLKVVVLMGTFSLAMAFAGNDLVNFIGVPITGYLAFENWRQSGIHADEHYQGYLASNDVIVPNYMLLIAGIIMALTLWLSAKAKKVTETEVSLGSQHEGEERFKPNNISRSIVKTSMRFGSIFSLIVPKTIADKYNLSFEKSKMRQATIIHDKPAFDLVRAASNLVIASILIAWATSMKLPLSTTYVSFMVAMGTSLADRAWGKETAVYRVAGVLSVIGGWLITAIIAFGVSGFLALILYKTEVPGALVLLFIASIYIITSHINFAKKEKNQREGNNKLLFLQGTDADILLQNKKMVTDTLDEINQHFSTILDALNKSQSNILEKTNKKLKELEEYGFKLRAQSIRYIKSLNTSESKPAEILLYSTDLLQDITNSSLTLSEECMHYTKNLHRQPDKEFVLIINELKTKMFTFISTVCNAVSQNKLTEIENIKIVRDDVRNFINQQIALQVQHIQQNKPGVKQAILQTSILLQSRDILAVTLRIVKMYKKYI